MKRKTRALINRKVVLDDGSIVQAVVWELPEPLPESKHRFKYRFYYGKEGRSLVRYDNERGKGDHRHYPEKDEPYLFTNLRALYRDFLADVERYSNHGRR
jgi:hypothetical protein